MKIFLLTSVMAMLAAGIYGTIDLALDVRNGTLIQYEEEEPVTMERFIAKSKTGLKATQLKTAQKKEVVKPPVLLNDFSMSDFSRGEPPMFLEALLPVADSLNDSLKNTDIAAALGDTVKAMQEAAEEEAQKKPAPLKPEEARKLDMRLYSRSKPRSYAKEVATDSVKTDKVQN